MRFFVIMAIIAFSLSTAFGAGAEFLPLAMTQHNLDVLKLRAEQADGGFLFSQIEQDLEHLSTITDAQYADYLAFVRSLSDWTEDAGVVAQMDAAHAEWINHTLP